MTESSGYARWRGWAEQFAEGADVPESPLPSMADMGGSLALERLAVHLNRALELRTKKWNEALSKSMMEATRGGDPRRALAALELALVRARRDLEPIQRFTRSPLLLDELRDALSIALDEAMSDLQARIEQDLRKSGPVAEQALAVFRRTPLDRPLVAPAPPSGGSDAPLGRRVVIIGGAE